MNIAKSGLIVKRSFTILQILPSLETGGVESGTIELALALKNKGFNPIVASQGGKLIQILTNHGIRHITLPLQSKNPFQIILNIFRLKAVLKKHRVNLLHARSRAPAWSARVACHWNKIPFVTTFHGTYNFHNKIKRLYNSVMVSGHRIIAVSNYIKDHILSRYERYVNPEHVIVIQRGIDLEKYSRSRITAERLDEMKKRWGVNAKIPLILMPARLTRWKGQLVLIQALSILKSQGYEFQCILAGSSQGRTGYLQEMTDLIGALDLKKDIHIDERCPDLPAGYMLSDLVIHASTDPEAFGRVIIEAQAMGIPVIASNIGAPQEIIDHQQTGWLHQAGNYEDLAQKIQDILELSKKDKALVVRQAKDKVKRDYSNHLMFEKTIEVYNELLCQ